MSSEKNGQLTTFVCDACGEAFEIAGEFRESWTAAKQDGWRTFKNGEDEWEHRCPDCVGMK